MRAVVVARPGGPDVLEVRDVPAPEPGPGEVRVRVRATALNRADLLQRRGLYPAPPGFPQEILGLEFSGEVETSRGSRFQKGDRVCGLVGGGSYAELIVAHERTVAPIGKLSFEEAAALPEAFITAHDALFRLGRTRPGSRVLLHAAGSGVGLAALQLAHAVHAETFGTSRTKAKLEKARAFGLDHALDATRFDEEIGARGVDVIVDFVGAGYLSRNLKALAPLGRLVSVGLLGGRKDEVDLGLLLSKRLTLVGTSLRGRPLEEKIAVTRTFEDEVLPLVARGVLRPVIDRTLPLFEKVREAHELLEANDSFGKIVLTL